MNSKIIFLICIIGLASAMKADSYNSLWSTWKTQHKKIYAASEELLRFGIFVENVEKINRLNAENDSVKFAINKFADLTGHEFSSIYASGTFTENHSKFVQANTITLAEGDLPKAVDWRNKGAVTPVKDQGKCGSCWAFSAVGVLEGFYFINNGTLLSFSEQQLIDCDVAYNMACSGGWPYHALMYTGQNGMETESDYPYVANDDGNCTYNRANAVQTNKGYKFLAKKSVQVKTALVNSPVSVAVEADQDIFQFYKSGVVVSKCGSNVNHAVLAVGYEKVGVEEAFIVKNSWGTSWGQDGYIYISTYGLANFGNGVCGILSQAAIATN